MDHDDTVGNQALVHELRLARKHMRGDVLRATASYQCENAKCPVSLVRLGVAEEIGRTAPMQGPNICPRCRKPMAYVGLDPGR